MNKLEAWNLINFFAAITAKLPDAKLHVHISSLLLSAWRYRKSFDGCNYHVLSCSYVIDRPDIESKTRLTQSYGVLYLANGRDMRPALDATRTWALEKVDNEYSKANKGRERRT